MPAPFRDDLEAARSRADALAEQNEELREELTRLRAGSPHPPDQPPADPELVRLAERTLEKLEHLTEDAHPPSAPSPALADAHAELTETADLLASGPRAPAPLAPPRADIMTTDARRALDVVEQLRTAHREELALASRRASRNFWIGLALGIGVGIGIGIAAVLR